jgi:carbonic anhydrase/acetyltransferase-like protein (isoleucine patch superfamily)
MSSADLDGTPHPDPVVAGSARVLGIAWLGAGAVVAQGTVVRSVAGAVTIGAGSAVLENSVVIGGPSVPVTIGSRTVFGHRAVVVGATVGDVCEIGNGTVVLPGARLGDRVFTGEGTVVPAGADIPDEAVVVGRPGRIVRRATDADLERLAALRGGDLAAAPPGPLTEVGPDSLVGGSMGTLYEYRGTSPRIDPTAIVFDSAEITGDVVVGPRTLIGAGVKIIGDAHGPVRIGADVQILENTVLHLLPDNELVVDDGVVIGPACMIHGCRLGTRTVVEPAAIVCDGAAVGAGSLVKAGSCVKQRDVFGDRVVLEGFPATVVGERIDDGRLPPWALPADAVASLVRREP